jgi:hypothetical protein
MDTSLTIKTIKDEEFLKSKAGQSNYKKLMEIIKSS